MEAIRQFRVWNYQMDRWTDGFVHSARPKNESIREFTNLDILGRVLIMKNRTEFSGHDSPNFRIWLNQVKKREVSILSPGYNEWLNIQN
jgi:hypothetical protein